MVVLIAILLMIFVLAPPWSIVVLLVAAVLEVFEIRFLLRWSGRLDRRTKKTTGIEGMIGATADVVEPCIPTGTVMFHGELWEASSTAEAGRGERVRILAVDGLRLRVAPLR
jgi:membrane-bound serine protease (ClpP class)